MGEVVQVTEAGYTADWDKTPKALKREGTKWDGKAKFRTCWDTIQTSVIQNLARSKGIVNVAGPENFQNAQMALFTQMGAVFPAPIVIAADTTPINENVDMQKLIDRGNVLKAEGLAVDKIRAKISKAGFDAGVCDLVLSSVFPKPKTKELF